VGVWNAYFAECYLMDLEIKFQSQLDSCMLSSWWYNQITWFHNFRIHDLQIPTWLKRDERSTQLNASSVNLNMKVSFFRVHPLTIYRDSYIYIYVFIYLGCMWELNINHCM
jgi:hypothetical protein